MRCLRQMLMSLSFPQLAACAMCSPPWSASSRWCTSSARCAPPRTRSCSGRSARARARASRRRRVRRWRSPTTRAATPANDRRLATHPAGRPCERTDRLIWHQSNNWSVVSVWIVCELFGSCQRYLLGEVLRRVPPRPAPASTLPPYTDVLFSWCSY